MKKSLYVLATAIVALAHATAIASPSQAREACKQFVPKSGYQVQEWGETWNWTVIDNKDGSTSVGMRFMGTPPGGRLTNLYVTCITRGNGDTWRLEQLVRLQ